MAYFKVRGDCVNPVPGNILTRSQKVRLIARLLDARADYTDFDSAALCSPANTVAMSFSSTVSNRKPKAQIPAVTFHSTRLGEYSTIS